MYQVGLQFVCDAVQLYVEYIYINIELCLVRTGRAAAAAAANTVGRLTPYDAATTAAIAAAVRSCSQLK